MRTLLAPLVALLVLLAVLGPLERLFPSVARRRSAWRTDVAWFLSRGLFEPLVKLSVAVTVLPYALVLGLPLDQTLTYGHGPLAALPWGMQLALALLLTDAVGYWNHRLRHRTGLWRVHSVHHSADPVDWLAATRVHPLDAAVGRVPIAIILVAVGLDLRAIAAVAPVLGAYGLLLHANVRWPASLLRGIAVTPDFHRWHHASDGAPADGCNFGGLLTVWDRAFGTYHLPPEPAAAFGVIGPAPPPTFFGQLAHPFRGRIRRREEGRWPR
jgi:sterol desaturase/sphingolipid hydroxylase (fatty acid hydroxylase superfamily)